MLNFNSDDKYLPILSLAHVILPNSAQKELQVVLKILAVCRILKELEEKIINSIILLALVDSK
jgi:hypothetical protein